MSSTHDTVQHAIVFAMIAAALFGTALVTTQSGLKHMNALSGARISIPVAAALFWLMAPAFDLSGWHASAAAVFAVVGIFFPAAVTLLTFEANRRLGPTVAGAIGSTAPLFAVLAASLFLGESLGARELVATSGIVLGTMALYAKRGGNVSVSSRFVLWLPLSAAVLRAFAQVLAAAGLALWPNPFAAALVGYSVSTAVIWMVPLLNRRRQAAVFSSRGVLWFALTGVLNGTAVLSMYSALRAGPVQIVSPLVATYPLFTLALGMLALRQERLTRRLIAGVVLIVAGIMVLLAR